MLIFFCSSKFQGIVNGFNFNLLPFHIFRVNFLESGGFVYVKIELLFKIEIKFHKVELTQNIKMLKNPDFVFPPTQF